MSREDIQMREGLLGWAGLMGLSFGLSSDQRETAVQAIRSEFAALPEGTARKDLEAVRDRNIERVNRDHEKKKAKAKAIEDSVNHVYSYVGTLAKEWDFGEDTWTLAQELKPIVEEQLEDELTGKESPEQAMGISERIIREYLDVPRPRK